MAKTYDVVILSDDQYVAPENPSAYEKLILGDDGLVEQGLAQHGLHTARVSWSDPSFDWASTRYALFRSTWDYFYRFAEFRQWLTAVADATRLINDHRLIEWNLDKHYLHDLSVKGIKVTPTHYCRAQEPDSLQAISAARRWTDVVIKPTISGTAMDTHKILQKEMVNHEALFSQLCQKQIMMVQPLQHFILEEGEYSLVVIDGAFTHAVQKVAKPGDFRVQSDFGGTSHDYQPSKKEIAFAEHVVACCPQKPHYARVDMIYDNDGDMSLVELELIEPELWFRQYPQAATQLANSIAREIKK